MFSIRFVSVDHPEILQLKWGAQTFDDKKETRQDLMAAKLL